MEGERESEDEGKEDHARENEAKGQGDDEGSLSLTIHTNSESFHIYLL